MGDRALRRGADQCGTVGAGNHFIEIVAVDRIEDDAVATAFGLRGAQRGADELAIGQRDAVGRRGIPQAAEGVGADLVAEPARSRVDQHADL